VPWTMPRSLSTDPGRCSFMIFSASLMMLRPALRARVLVPKFLWINHGVGYPSTGAYL
jgi:hypothetical protein